MGSFGGNRGGRGFYRGASRGGNFRRDNNFRGGDRGDRQMFDAICSNCGNACQVPFRPTGEKPVYCSDCFEKMGNRSSDGGGRPDRSGRFERNDRPQPQRVDTQFKVQLDTISQKLDQIMSLLTPKVEVAAVKTPKVKKAKVTKKEVEI